MKDDVKESGFPFPEEDAFQPLTAEKEAEIISKLQSDVASFKAEEATLLQSIKEELLPCKSEVDSVAGSFAKATPFAGSEEKAKIVQGILKAAEKLESRFQSVRQKQAEYSMLAGRFDAWFDGFEKIGEANQSALQSQREEMEAATRAIFMRVQALSDFFSFSTPLFFDKLGELLDTEHGFENFSLTAANTLFSSYMRLFERLMQNLDGKF